MKNNDSKLMCKLSVNTLPQVLVEQYLIEIAKNYNVPYKSKATNMVESPADLISIGFTKDVKKGALGRGGGTVAGTGPTLWASPISVPGPLPVPSPAPSFSSLPPERQVSTDRETESGMGLQIVLECISKWAF
uniref:Uncharacterized protein n=1 Tax=Equus caballus TaxID=9796 RepID=A0A9L0T510_HORSE